MVAMAEEHSRKPYLPVAPAEGLELIIVDALPVVEVANEINTGGVRGPLAEDPGAVSAAMHPVKEMVVYPVREGAVLGYPILQGKDIAMTAVYHALVGFEIRVCLVYLIHIMNVFP